MRLLLALLLGGAAANPLLSLASKAKSLVTAKSLQLGGGIGAALPVLMCQPEATGTCKNNQGKGKVIKGVALAVAAAALGVVLLPFK